MREIFPDAAAPQIGHVARGKAWPEAEAAVTALARLYAYPAAGTGAAPWIRANMIASADGAASRGGRSGGLSGEADRLVFSVLRSLADVILVGAGTARAERYQPVREREVWAALRAGQAPLPPIAVITGSLALDPDSPLLAGTAGPRTIVLTTEAAPAARRAAAARHAEVIVTGPDVVSPAAAVGSLAALGYRRVLVEGGPSLLSQIVAADLLDDLCLTFSPTLEGGSAGRILAPPHEGEPARGADPDARAWHGAAARLSLAHVIEDAGSLLCRYLRRPILSQAPTSHPAKA